MKIRIFTILVSLISWSMLSLIMSCSGGGDDPAPVDCSTNNLAISTTTTNPTGCGTNNGVINATGSGGTAPYQFSLNGGAFQTTGAFQNLGSGNYEITIRDSNNCTKSVNATLSTASTLAISFSVASDTQCLSDNGSVTINATGGTSPYQFQLGSGNFSSSNTFASLKSGQYTVTVKDAANCTLSQSVTVTRGNTGTSYATLVKPIIESKCSLSSCHDTGTGARDWTNFNNVKNNAAAIKTRTANKSMPPAGSGTLSQAEIDLIACWVDDGAPNN